MHKNYMHMKYMHREYMSIVLCTYSSRTWNQFDKPSEAIRDG
ncbi:hypothetical protein GCM10026982_62280 [Nocardiopsis aegyptia]